MAQRRSRGPYILTATLAKLLTGEPYCEWAGWFKAHHENWTKAPSDFDSATRIMEHTALANQEREIREQLGYTVTIENQSLFRIRGCVTIGFSPRSQPDLQLRGTWIPASAGKMGW